MSQKLPQSELNAGIKPKAGKDEIWANAMNIHRGRLAFGVGTKDSNGVGKAKTGTMEGVELTGLLEGIETAESGKDAVSDLALGAKALSDLEVLMAPRRI